MLRLMREKATSWLIKVLLGAIVVVFIFWGIGSFRAQRVGRVALVNGEQITLDEYRNAYNNLIEQLRQQFRNSLTEEMIKMLRVREQTLNQLIDNKLLVQEARRLKFRVSDKELAAAITQIEAFKRDGVFDNRLYQNVLSQIRMTPEDFEDSQREAMLIDKLRMLVNGGIKVSEQEAKEWFGWTNASVSIDFTLFDPKTYKNINPLEDEVNAYFEENKERYKTDAQVKVRYLHFAPAAYLSAVAITDEEIRYYYDDNQQEFKAPKTVEARHILIKVDGDADAETNEKTKKRALNILKMAREGNDFSELAKQYSDGPSGDSGGYLGTFKKEDMVKPFADKAFSMNAGDISEPVRTQFGWHIIKVERVNKASTLTFDEAKEEIKKKMADEKAKNLAYEVAEKISEVSFEGDDLLQAARDHKLNVKTTDFFTREGPAKGVLERAKFASEAFDLLEMEISDIIDYKDGYYILQVVEKLPETIPQFATVKEDVKADLVEKIQNEKANEDANEFLSAVKNGKPWATESEKYHVTPATTDFFKRNDSIPEIGFEREISTTAFELTRANRWPEKVIKGSKGYYVMQFNGRKASKNQGFDAEKEEILQRLQQQKQSKAFTALLSQLKNAGEISIKEGFLEQ
ncbi:MAG: SurA N-terminal domain-containing protein [Desulfobacterales bacterium]|nr:MAG: SurA N-terminal domain-containing protein [Desulfobacterales bacterium]